MSGIVTSESAQVAKHALEKVCSGAQLDCLAQYYSPRFADHVNDSEFRGHCGVRASVGLYRRVLSNLAITVEDQVIDGPRVVSRFVLRQLGMWRLLIVMLRSLAVSRPR